MIAAIATDASSTHTASIQSITKRSIRPGSNRLYSRQEKPQAKSLTKEDVLKLVGDVLFAKTKSASDTKPKDDQPTKDQNRSSETKSQDSGDKKPKEDAPKPKTEMPAPKKPSGEGIFYSTSE